MAEMTKGSKILVRKREWKRIFWRLGHTLDDDIKVNPKEIECKDSDCVHVARNNNQWHVCRYTVVVMDV
jgi:hypothetical protein